MKKIILEKLIYKNYLKTALTSILFIEIALVLIYFTANRNIVDTSVNFILNDIKKNVYSLVDNLKADIEHKFEDVERLSYVLQNEHQNFFKYQKDINLENKPEFNYANNGMYYKLKDNGGSSVVVSKNTKITPDVEKRLVNSELFDETFKTVVDTEEMIVAAYFNSFDDFNRYYPFIPNTYDAFPSDIKMENYNFYYEANLKHNPEKKVVWTDVYLDPAGQGWMLSSIVPIYNKDFLEGVTGLDVTVNTIIESFLSLKLPYKGSSFLIDKNGDIIAITKEIASVLDLEAFKKYQYKDKIHTTILKEDMQNINSIKSDAFKTILNNVINSKKYDHDLTINDENFLLFTKKIEKLDWFVISMVNEKEILSNVRELEEHYQNVGYLIIIFIVLFYLVFFIYLYSKAKEFVRILNTPIQKVINMTKDLGNKKDLKKLEKCGIEEIDTLSENFNILAEELDLRTKKLIKSETNRAFHEKLANTDALTGIYNRRFLEDFSRNYMKIVKREHGRFSLLLLDIDNFKTINDTYGHDIGDEILRNLIKCVKSIIRENDLVVRLGGDEFIVLLPSTNKENAIEVANKLITSINAFNKLKDEKLKFTITIGSSEYEKDDTSIEPLIKRADDALYKAKSLGKNCVV